MQSHMSFGHIVSVAFVCDETAMSGVVAVAVGNDSLRDIINSFELSLGNGGGRLR